MGKFDSLLKTHTSKRNYEYDYKKLYKKGRFSTSVDYSYFENLYILELLDNNKKKKYNEDLISLWGQLDMKSYIDYDLGNTINLYFIDGFDRIPVNQLSDYNFMPEDSRKMNLLDIKYIKRLSLENVKFENLYLATYEILDANNDFRPYVQLFMKDEKDNFVEFGYGYDSNNNGNIELFINTFNYPVFLTPKGWILLPLTNKKIKLDVYDYIEDTDIQKLEQNRHD